MLLVNNEIVEYCEGLTVAEVGKRTKPDADIFIVNGYPVAASFVLGDGDQCWLVKRGESVSADEMRNLLYARHTPGVQARLQDAVVGIMGLGGLGSTVALALARMGIGSLILADFDLVEPSNLNRQQYFVDQIGLKKTEALKDNIGRINPYVRVEIIDQRLTEDLIPALFADVDALVECFDDPVMKAAALRARLQHLEGVFYVCASGMAGYGSNNEIKTRRLYPGVFLVGDQESAAEPGQGLMAARVGIAAHHQANQVVRLLLGEDTENKQQ
ncbi:MAG: sulfur carrier protein ThiS adenylyltransferase ThiF [Desulfobulbaceae bacterium]|nr:sulfur carrier protein ThiS adenylyltransferase ThiF [Desulfobulbaceae bacterium]HIJ78509.1 sulfur carrier protein ThiS adenylyltransferase ThiF [Deltaproteobacteria bacterium]